MAAARTAILATVLLLAPLTAPASVSPIPLASLNDSCRLLGERLGVLRVSAQGCLKAGLRVAAVPSAQGQPILWRDFAPSAARPGGAPLRILLVGGIHGDELSSSSIVFDWMGRLARERFQPFHWRVVPALNPDGVLAQPATRVNANGVDLNRNFFTPDWADRALPYWERKTLKDPRRYPGAQPLSEPESRWLAAEIERFKPDAVIQVHAPYGLLDYDGPHAPPDQIGFLHLRLLGAYPGSLGNFAGRHLGIPVLTLELPNAGLMPPPSQSARMWADLLTWMESHLQPRQTPPAAVLPVALRQPWNEVLRRFGGAP